MLGRIEVVQTSLFLGRRLVPLETRIRVLILGYQNLANQAKDYHCVRGYESPRATAGTAPVSILTVPSPATERALNKAGIGVKDIEIREINEAFTRVPVKTVRDLDIDPHNVDGDDTALGYLFGANDASLIYTAIDELGRHDVETALCKM